MMYTDKQQIEDAQKIKRILEGASKLIEDYATKHINNEVATDTTMDGTMILGYKIWSDVQMEAGINVDDAIWEIDKALDNAREYLEDAGADEDYIAECFGENIRCTKTLEMQF